MATETTHSTSFQERQPSPSSARCQTSLPRSTQTGRKASQTHQQAATALGWLSVGLGMAELLAPRTIERWLGVRGHSATVQAFGVREIAAGVGLLSGRGTTGWLWGRVAGDALDLAALGTLHGETRRPENLAMATLAVAGVTAVDVWCAAAHQADGRRGQESSQIYVRKSLTVGSSPEQAYDFWRRFEDFPRFMKHLKSVHKLDGPRSHWVATGPAGTEVEWDAEIVSDEPGRLLAWKSLDGADVDHRGRVQFFPAPGNRGTVITVELQYDPPAGKLGQAIAWLFGESPEQQITEDLRRFKQLFETGEIPTVEGQPSGGMRGSLLGW